MGKNWRCTRRGCLKMSGNVTELRPKQQEAILALLTTTNVEQAARAVKITPRTLYRWQQDPEFDKVFRKARRGKNWRCTRRGCLKMSENVTELRPKQQEAILALLTTTNVEQAARIAS